MATVKKKPMREETSEQEIVTMANSVSDFIAGRTEEFSSTVAGIAALASLAIAGFSLKRSMDEQKAGPLFARL